jgi:hypothetical protein
MKKMAGPQPRVLGFARLMLARLGLNDGAKLWVSFKLYFKTNDFYSILHVAINFDGGKFTKFVANYKSVSRFLIDPIAIIYFIARKFTKFIAFMSLYQDSN